jgi:hypothetical protein
VILLIVPQVVLGGAVIPVPGIVSAPTSTRWGFEALVSISGAGADVAADACWALPEETRDGMSLEDKAARGCRCMGLNALNQAACNFPGVGSFYDPVLDQPRPAEPAPIGSPPAEPALPAAPEAPADQTDQKAMAQFLQDLQAHQAQVEQIEAGYKAQLADYQAKADTFAADATAFQKALGEWEIKRNTAVNKAESLIDLFHRDFGWAFVDKDDSRAFGVKIVTAWGVQVLMIAIMLALILVSVYRKDRV